MMIIVRQPDRHEFGIHADRICIETAGHGRYRLIGADGVVMEVPGGKVEHVRLSAAKPAGKPSSENVRGRIRKAGAFLSGMRGRRR